MTGKRRDQGANRDVEHVGGHNLFGNSGSHSAVLVVGFVGLRTRWGFVGLGTGPVLGGFTTASLHKFFVLGKFRTIMKIESLGGKSCTLIA
jgi:hypothetical protein